MSDGLHPGLVGEAAVAVTKDNLAPHVPVFSTPDLVRLMEAASAHAVRECLPPDTVTVGYVVNIRHLAPTPVGGTVRARAVVESVEGNKVTFRLEARYGDVKVGDGLHVRALVKASSFDGKGP